MKPSKAKLVAQQARKAIAAAMSNATIAERKLAAAGKAHRRAKLKLKQTKRWSRQTKKAAKKAAKELVAAQQVLQDLRTKLQKAEKKLLKQTPKVRAASAKSQPKAAKPIARKTARHRLIAKGRPKTLPKASRSGHPIETMPAPSLENPLPLVDDTASPAVVSTADV